MKLFYIFRMHEGLSYNRYVFAESVTDAIAYAYPNSIAVEHIRGSQYCVELIRDCYEYIDVTEVPVRAGLIL
jgi:hypothetical protein